MPSAVPYANHQPRRIVNGNAMSDAGIGGMGGNETVGGGEDEDDRSVMGARMLSVIRPFPVRVE